MTQVFLVLFIFFTQLSFASETFIVGIAGGTGSGKTRVAKKILTFLEEMPYSSSKMPIIKSYFT